MLSSLSDETHDQLGPPRNGLKFFAAVEVINLAKDIQWLAKATNVVHQHWRKKNQRKKDNPSGDAQDGAAA